MGCASPPNNNISTTWMCFANASSETKLCVVVRGDVSFVS